MAKSRPARGLCPLLALRADRLPRGLLRGPTWSKWRDRCVEQGMEENTFKPAVTKLKNGGFVWLDEHDKLYWRTSKGDEQVGCAEGIGEVA